MNQADLLCHALHLVDDALDNSACGVEGHTRARYSPSSPRCEDEGEAGIKPGQAENQSLLERFESKYICEPNSGCWIWIAYCDKSTGYGRITTRTGVVEWAHRVSYALYVGPIPNRLVIDHLCRVHSCVNPQHLQVTTDRVNILRGQSVSAIHANKTHCINGHPFTIKNTYFRKGNLWRMCRRCCADRKLKERANGTIRDGELRA